MKKISPRKLPSQKRSRQMVNDILEASIRVLKKNGGKSFNTIKVAEVAGISVGSLYQYFPNKEAILFHLQEKEWFETWALMESILEDKDLSPKDRLIKLVREFFITEYNEADLRRSLGEHAQFENTKSYKELRTRGHKTIQVFLKEFNPKLKDLDFHVDFLLSTVSNIGEDISSRTKDEKELLKWADKVSAMLMSTLQG